jgi:hypothetical protein
MRGTQRAPAEAVNGLSYPSSNPPIVMLVRPPHGPRISCGHFSVWADDVASSNYPFFKGPATL